MMMGYEVKSEAMRVGLARREAEGLIADFDRRLDAKLQPLKAKAKTEAEFMTAAKKASEADEEIRELVLKRFMVEQWRDLNIKHGAIPTIGGADEPIVGGCRRPATAHL
jgi:hypothetical protein